MIDMLLIYKAVSYHGRLLVKHILTLLKKESASVFVSFDKSGSLPLPAPTGLSSLGMSVGFYCFLFFLSG